MNSIDIFPWNENFNTGIPLIDEQHKKLADLINLLASYVAFNANIPSLNVIFDELAAYAVYHFDAEEKIWHEFMPEDLFEIDHHKVHSSFLTEVLRLKSEESTKPTNKVIEEILAFLTRWLAAHILESDRSMAMVVIAMQSGMSLEAAKKQAAGEMRGATRVLIDIILSIYESLSTNTLHLMRELAEQKRMALLLDDQERHFELLLSTIPVGIFETDTNGKCNYVNDRWSEITGLSFNDAMGDGWTKALHPDDKDMVYTEWTTSRTKSRSSQLEYRFLQPDGKIVWVLGQSVNFKSQLKDQSGIVGIITDITERKQTNENLQRESEKNLALLRNASDGIHILDYDGNVVEASDSFCNMLGYSRNEVIGMNVTGLDVGFANAEEQLKVLRKQFEKPVRSQFETRHRHKDGSIFDVEISGYPLALDGQKVLFNSSRDVTERKKIEATLEEKEERLRLALITTKQGWFDYNVVTGEILVSPEYVTMLGFDPNTFHSTLKEWQENIHPDDRDTVNKLFQECIKNGGPISAEYRRRNSKGDWIWINSIGSITKWGPNHQSLRMIGLHTNISERKQTENNLSIAATAFESQEGIMVTDANNNILRVNSAFTTITGYTAEEAVGQTPRLLSSGNQDKSYYESMWNRLNETGVWEGEIWNRRKNGEVYPEHLTITSVKDADGLVTNYVATLTDITMSKAASDEIKNLAFYDPLTRLPNRRLLMDRLQQALAASTRTGLSGAVLFLDLDHFKTLNDTLGHDVGDLLLQQVSGRLSNCVREGDTVARIGGDEFVVLLEGLDKQRIEAAAQAEAIGQKVLTSLSQPYQLGTYVHHSTTSIGAMLFKDHEVGIDSILKQADIAMYQSKSQGRNTLRFYDPKMQEAINTRVDMERQLRQAIEQKQFELYYQIQLDNSGCPLGAEALIRWNHPERNMISPLQFIPLAEETGLILPIGQWVLETACAQLAVWRKNVTCQDLALSVNVSAKQFHQANFVKQVLETIKRHEIDPTKLKLELTESLLITNIDDVVEKMKALSQMGIRFSLDDFGTGFSSLQYLKKLPLSQLKIDQSFVRDIVVDESDLTIVRTIITMAHSLDIDVIAEGVETDEQRKLLLDNGCTHYQGYLFSKPVPIGDFEAFLREI